MLFAVIGTSVLFVTSNTCTDTNRQLTVAFDVYILPGSTWAAGLVTVHVFDVTNSKLVPITANSIDASGHFVAHFTTNSSTSYRLIFHVASTATPAWTMAFDSVYIGPTYLPSSPAMSDWQDGGALTITATTTNPTKGTTSKDKIWWKRVGDSAEIYVEYTQTGSGTAGSGSYKITLPAGLSIDTTKVSTRTPGNSSTDSGNNHIGSGSIGSGSSAGSVSVYAASATEVWCVASVLNAGPTISSWGSSNYTLATSDLRISFSARIPITGWSGSTAVQPGSRYLWAQRFAANATRVTTTPSKPGEYRSFVGTSDSAPTPAPSAADGFKITGDAVSTDVNEWNVFVGPEKVVAMVAYQTTGRMGEVQTVSLWSDNSPYRGCLFHYDPVTGVAKIKAARGTGATAGWWLDAAATAVTTYASIYFDILVADDPVPVALAPSVHVEASSDAGQVLTASTTAMQFEDEIIDTHGAWSGTAFVPPVAGVYMFEGITEQSSSGTARVIYAYIGGTIDICIGVTPSTQTPASFAFTMRLAAGASVTLRSSSSWTRSYDRTRNRISITRVGD